ncbi:cupin domain-containing protein [Ureibacillus thermosphaericus]|uniref:cupin domain-containing protein n=1 Tax=Ureibacillus thermosphaericus TaxID=51173 RepID=UPI0030C9A374
MNFFHYHNPYGYPYYFYESPYYMNRNLEYVQHYPYYHSSNYQMPYRNPNYSGNNVDYQRMLPLFPNPHGFSQFPSQDLGPEPATVDIEKETKNNNAYRTALWTGPHLQVTLMSILPGEDIGLEIHPDTDQFLRIEQGEGIVEMGRTKNHLNYRRRVKEDSAIMVPAGTWHNVINTGNIPLKLYSIYAPPHHPHGTVQRTKAEAMAQENHQ